MTAVTLTGSVLCHPVTVRTSLPCCDHVLSPLITFPKDYTGLCCALIVTYQSPVKGLLRLQRKPRQG